MIFCSIYAYYLIRSWQDVEIIPSKERKLLQSRLCPKHKHFRICHSCCHRSSCRCMCRCRGDYLSHTYSCHRYSIALPDRNHHICHSYSHRSLTSTHLPSQSTSSSRHPHVPLRQERPAGQTFPHEPQADSSLFRSAQCVPLHSVIPFGRMLLGQRTNCLLFQNSTMSKQTKLYN